MSKSKQLNPNTPAEKRRYRLVWRVTGEVLETWDWAAGAHWGHGKAHLFRKALATKLRRELWGTRHVRISRAR